MTTEGGFREVNLLTFSDRPEEIHLVFFNVGGDQKDVDLSVDGARRLAGLLASHFGDDVHDTS